MKSREIIRRLKAEGWEVIRVKGSHHMMAHPTNPLVIAVKHPQKDCPLGTLKSIERQSGVKLR